MPSRGQCEALVVAVANHDQVDMAARLPARIEWDYPGDVMARSYWLSHRLWDEIARRDIVRLANSLVRNGALSVDDARMFKDIRARAKQLRFACAVLDARHRYPPMLDRLTRAMGQAQDAVKARRSAAARARGVQLRLLLVGPAWATLTREIATFTAAGPDGLRNHIAGEMATVAEALAGDTLTNKSFHEVRKVVSRLVAFYDTLTVLDPSDYHARVDRYLSTINGLMGSLHDTMVERKTRARRDYMRAAEPMPETIRERLEMLVVAFTA